MSRRGLNRPKGAPALPGAGRPVTKATLTEGIIVFLSQVYPDGNHADLGRGIVGKVERKDGHRVVVIPQNDGSELRIVIGEE